MTSPDFSIKTPYELMGGEAGVRRLVDRFYDLMDTAPEAATIRALHARMRMRHMPFSIGAKERDEWLWCMDHAIAEHPMPDEVKAHLQEKLRHLADFMRNREE